MARFLLSLALLLFSAGACWCYGMESCASNYKDSNSIWCVKKNIQNLSRIMDMVPQNATRINLSQNKISTIPVDIFRKFWRLQDLSLQRNNISFLKRAQFGGLVQLKRLNLSSNILSEIQPDTFQGLTQLRDLLLYNNHITKIPTGLFHYLPQVTTLDLSLNKLKYLNSSQCKSSTLENLDLSYNNISWLSLSGFSGLIFLCLSFNPILHPVPHPLALAPSITRLMLQGIAPEVLAGLSDKFKHGLQETSFSISTQRSGISVCGLLKGMDNLKRVNIDLSRFTFPKNTSVLIGCKTPKFLILKNASLGDFEKFRLVQGGEHTSRLSLVQCGLRSISEKTFQGFQRLSNLNVEDNDELNIHPKTFSVFRQLRKLSLDNVGVSEPNTDWFQNLLYLETLSMMNNDMTKLAPNAFSALRKLRSLSLRHNLLQVIAGQPFCNLTMLTTLDLSVNIIYSIENGSFTDLVRLKNLSLNGNRIKTVNPDILRGLANLVGLNLYDNQLHFREGDSPFITLKSLHDLNLGYQGPITIGMGYLGSTLFKGLENLQTLILTSATLITFHPNTFAPLVNLYSLYISDITMTHNNLTALFHPLVSLTDLVLGKTGLDGLPVRLLPQNNTLKYFRLMYNHIHVLEKSVLDNLPFLKYLDVTVNPLSCSCQNAWFKNWSVKNLEVQVPYLYDFHCENDPTLPHFWEFNDKECSYDSVNFNFFLSTALLNLFILFSGLTWHKHRSALRYLILLLHSRIRGRRKGNKTFTYDAFISYSSLDEPWVMGELVPHMEGPTGKGFRLCLHHRDFRLGAAILENIEAAIYSSRRTLCVVSRDFLRSEWCALEFQLASLRLLCDRSDVLLLVFLEKIPDHCLSSYTRLRRMVHKNTYLLWPEDAAEQEAFWIRLQDALREDVEEEGERFGSLLVEGRKKTSFNGND
ncbi:toll-like receptor 13 [Anguilla anguilla]|uniref:toll-like receptor 13 n=1 Tax=Anguilla anguilla TaxID=7936 RepID=UPI0015A7FDF9|nr:toll-like receptor 13 [Anguilla anguilla]